VRPEGELRYGVSFPSGAVTMASVSDVDDPVRSAAVRWRLTVGERLTGGTSSAVYAASDEFGRDLVLKLPKSSAGDTAAEAAALAAWSGTGATVTLIAATDDALLLTRIRPGTPMPWQP
jgi:streptomycin 6-kinase